MTTVTDRPTREPPELERLQRRVRGLTITVTILAVALLGLGAWMVYDDASTPETAVTSEVQAILDDYLAAWNESDVNAFRSLITDDYAYGKFGDRPWSIDAVEAQLLIGEEFDRHVEVIGEPVMYSEGYGKTVVAQLSMTDSDNLQSSTMVVNFLIVDESGTPKVASHWFVYFPNTWPSMF